MRQENEIICFQFTKQKQTKGNPKQRKRNPFTENIPCSTCSLHQSRLDAKYFHLKSASVNHVHSNRRHNLLLRRMCKKNREKHSFLPNFMLLHGKPCSLCTSGTILWAYPSVSLSLSPSLIPRFRQDCKCAHTTFTHFCNIPSIVAL